VASFHGMPKNYVDKGDPYLAQCIATTESFAQAHGSGCFKTPAHIPVALRLRRVAAALYRQDHRATGKGRRAPHCRRDARFSATASKRLEEIAQENAGIFRHMAASSLPPFPASMTSDAGMDVIRQLVLRELQGWI